MNSEWDSCLNNDLVRYQKPKFDQQTQNIEAHRIAKIHCLLASVGEQNADELYQALTASERGVITEVALFASAAEVSDFVKLRSHAFAFDLFSGKLRNRTFDYRTAMIHLVSYVHGVDKNQCELRTNFLARVQKFFGSISKMYPRLSFDDAREAFLAEHQGIFGTAKGCIFVKDAALKGIPSLFYSNLLPSLSSLVEMRKNFTVDSPYWDRSNSFSFIGRIVSSTANYAKALVMSGPYLNKSVYILCSNINFGFQNMSDVFPVDSKVEIRAHLSYNAKCDFTATALRALNSVPDRWTKKALTLGYRELTVRPGEPEALESTSSQRRQRATEQSREAQQMISKWLELDRLRLLAVGGKLDASGQTPFPLSELSLSISKREFKFPKPDDVCEFIRERPYLYRIVERDADYGNETVVYARSEFESKVLLDVLRLIDEKKPIGLEKRALFGLLKTGSCGPELQEEITRSDGIFYNLLDELKYVVRDEPRWDERRYLTLKGSFDDRGQYFPFPL